MHPFSRGPRLLAAPILLALCLLLAAGPMLAEGSRELVDWYDTEELVRILKDEGYGSVSVLNEKGNIRFKADGRTFVLFSYPSGDLQLYFGITGFELGAQDTNEWNRIKRLSRAYIDHEGDPVLEADLVASAGLSREMVQAFLRNFVSSAGIYHDFLASRQAASATPAVPAQQGFGRDRPTQGL